MLGSIFSKWFLGTLKTKNKEYRVKAVQKCNKYVKNWCITLTPIYMTTLFPGLVYTSTTHIHDHSLSWLGLYLFHPYTWPLSFLAWSIPLTPIYMTTLFPGLVNTSTTHIHDHSLSWLGLYFYHPYIWPFSFLAWSMPLPPIYMTNLSWLGLYLYHPYTWPLSFLAWSIPLTSIYMTTLFPGLVYTSNTHIHDHSLSWLGLYL
jgi:NADH:ubiquinone oxidoreductase subunit 6 (subunit J)